jgi:hypothetical protein
MATSNTIHIDVQTSGAGVAAGGLSNLDSNKLSSAVDALVKGMSSFDEAVKNFKTATEKQTSTQQPYGKQQHQEAMTERERLRLENKQVGSEGATNVQQQRNFKGYQDAVTRANLEKQRHDNKIDQEAAKFDIWNQKRDRMQEERVARRGNFWGAIGTVAGVALASTAQANYFTAQKDIGLALMQNPMQNGYNYGGTYEDITNINARQKFGAVTAGLTGAGGLIGLALTRSKSGALAGAAIGGGIGDVFGTYGLGRTEQQSHARSIALNNTMRMESLRGTDIPAYTIASGAMNTHKMTDIEVPFIQAVSKAVGVYNNNSTEMAKLTKHIVNLSQAAQWDVGTTTQVASALGYMSKQSGFNYDNITRTFAGAGVTDYAGGLQTAIGLQQSGFSAPQAIKMAAQYQQMTPQFAGAATNYFSDISGRGTSQMLSKATGFNFDAILDPGAKGHHAALLHAEQARDEAVTALNNGNPTQAIFLDKLFQTASQNKINLTTLPVTGTDFESVAVASGKIGTTGRQAGLNAITNQVTADAQVGIVNGKAATALNAMVDNITAAKDSLGGMSPVVNSATLSLQNFIKVLNQATAFAVAGSTGSMYSPK